MYPCRRKIVTIGHMPAQHWFRLLLLYFLLSYLPTNDDCGVVAHSNICVYRRRSVMCSATLRPKIIPINYEYKIGGYAPICATLPPIWGSQVRSKGLSWSFRRQNTTLFPAQFVIRSTQPQPFCSCTYRLRRHAPSCPPAASRSILLSSCSRNQLLSQCTVRISISLKPQI